MFSRCFNPALGFFFSWWLAAGLAAAAPAPGAEWPQSGVGLAFLTELSPAALQLAREVAGIASSTTLPRATQEKQISDAVRSALAAGTARTTDSAKKLAVAKELASAAAGVAPQFADTIANAVAFSPSMTRVPAARDRVRAATFAAARTAPAGGLSAALISDPSLPPGKASSTVPADLYGANSGFAFSAAASVRLDDNVYLNNSNEVSDTIFAVTPAVSYRFGRRSQVHGSIGLRTAFTKYVDGSVPNDSLGSGEADVSFDGGVVAVAAGASYQQLAQNSSDLVELNAKTIYRRDVLAVTTSVQAKLTEKVSVQTGANLSQNKYKTEGLVGSDDVSFPIRFYVETTPKVNLSAGVTYGTSKPQNGGPTAQDVYYNTGIWGNLSPNLSTQFSVGYRTRKVAPDLQDDMWAFDGVFNFTPMAKTKFALALSRGFGTGAQGENLKNTSYSLSVTNDPSPYWRLVGALSHRDVDYGAVVFTPGTPQASSGRQDSYWDGILQVSYLLSRSCSVALDVTVRGNDSSQNGADFSNRIIGLSFAYQF